jgi:hypothetical protein
MDKPKLKESRGPERIIQDALIDYLRVREWHVMETHGNVYQQGFPDLYAVHYRYRQRWIEVKNPLKFSFTPAQLDNFPIISRVAGIWILTAATEFEYKKLFGAPNWYSYLPAAN